MKNDWDLKKIEKLKNFAKIIEILKKTLKILKNDWNFEKYQIYKCTFFE